MKKNKDITVSCDVCGYKKTMVIDMNDPNAKDLIKFQEEKVCPNCGSHHTLHIK